MVGPGPLRSTSCAASAIVVALAAARGPPAPRRPRATARRCSRSRPRSGAPGRRLAASRPSPLALVLGSWARRSARPSRRPGRVLTRLVGRCTVEFYDVDLPFDPAAPRRACTGAVLLAVFAFCLLLALALAARRPLLAVLVLAVGAGWPATLAPGGSELALGGLILAGALVLLAGSRPRAKTALLSGGGRGRARRRLRARRCPRRPRSPRTSSCDWQRWDLYTKPHERRRRPLRLGLELRRAQLARRSGRSCFKVEAPDRPLYWRATTLDAFDGDNWREDLRDERGPYVAPASAATSSCRVRVSRKRLGRAEGDDRGARDNHLVGAERARRVRDARDRRRRELRERRDRARRPGAARGGSTYAVWSYRPPAHARAQLARSQAGLSGGADLASTSERASVPAVRRAPAESGRVASTSLTRHAPPYAPLYEAAQADRRPARDTRTRPSSRSSPGCATAAGFRYDEQPPARPGRARRSSRS